MIKQVLDIKKLISPEQCKIIGNKEREFSNIKPIYNASAGDLTFCSKKGRKGISLIERSKASVIICKDDILSENLKFDDKTLIGVKNPRLWFIRCVDTFFPSQKELGIHPTAIIGKNCQIGEDVYIGPYSIVDDNVVIGNRTRIDSHVHIFENVRIGENVSIKPGCVIGSDGFGFERNKEGELERFPHRGGVIIEDNVEIGANTCIDRGGMGNTKIGKGTKIDNLVHIGHNDEIGENCILVCLSCIGGSATIGNNVWISALSFIKESLTVGNNVFIGMGTIVNKNVKDNDVILGTPGKLLKGGRRLIPFFSETFK